MYRKPGYYEVPAGALLPNWCGLIADQDGWEKDLVACLKPEAIGRPARRVKELTLSDIVNIEGQGRFATSPEKLSALKHVLARFLCSLGVIDSYPKVIGYQGKPRISIDQPVDLMMTSFISFPGLDSLGGEFFSVETLKANLPVIIREIAYKRNIRSILIKRLRRRLGDIAYRVATGQAIDQHEKSFYIMCNETKDQNTWTADEVKAGRGPVVSMVECGDPLVGQTWELFKSVVEAGPFLKFGTVVSNQSLENLIYWFGPQIGTLTFKVGYEKKFGTWTEPVTEDVFSLPWSALDQLAAARNLFAGYRLEKDTGVMVHLPNRVPSSLGEEFESEWDMPQVGLRADLKRGSIAFSEAYFFSAWRERVISSGSSNATPDTLLTDIALHNKQVGESQLGGINLADYGLVDLEASKQYLGDKVSTDLAFNEEIYIPNEGRTDVTKKPIDMTPFYQRQGKKMFNPAFKEYVLVPMAWLHTPDPEAEEYIATQFNLNREARIQTQALVRISHRYALLSRLLSPEQMPINTDQLRALCKALAGF